MLNSIRRQRFSGLEVIVVDGGSADNTSDVVSAASDVVTHFVSETDNGIYDAINKGLAQAKGDLTVVLGADDELCDDALNNAYHFWRDGKTDIVAGRALMIDANGAESYREDEDFGQGALLTGIPFCHNAMFATRRAYDVVGGYDVKYRLAADAHWTHRAIRAGLACTRIDRPLVRYSLLGKSSMLGDLTMEESYRVVSENFPILDLPEIKDLFGDIRGWTQTGSVERILRKYPDAIELHVAIALAFQQRARRLAASPPALTPASAGAARLAPPISSMLLRTLGRVGRKAISE